ncbi:MAG: hypothetical protein JOZ61_00550 [Verrucomicrobia bacterium]|nr:hypothetical protein [Verrucomicrobiota bacterium]
MANAGPNQTITAVGRVVQLNGSASYDLAGLPITYQWSFVSKRDDFKSNSRNRVDYRRVESLERWCFGVRHEIGIAPNPHGATDQSAARRGSTYTNFRKALTAFSNMVILVREPSELGPPWRHRKPISCTGIYHLEFTAKKRGDG